MTSSGKRAAAYRALAARLKTLPTEHKDARLAEVHRQLERIDALVSGPDFLNLSGIFSEADSLQFLDFCHTTEEANARIASVLVSKLLETAKVGPGAPAPKHGPPEESQHTTTKLPAEVVR